MAGIQRDEYIGHNASTAIDHPLIGGIVSQRIGEVKTVGMGKFSVFKSLEGFFVVVGFIALVIGLLNAATGRGKVFGYGQANLAAIGQCVGLLDQPLAKASAPYYQTAVPVLDSTRNDFAGRCRPFIDQNNEFSVFEVTPGRSTERSFGRMFPFRVYDHFPPFQKFIGQLKCRIEVASSVARKVKDQVFHTLLFQLMEFLPEFL